MNNFEIIQNEENHMASHSANQTSGIGEYNYNSELPNETHIQEITSIKCFRFTPIFLHLQLFLFSLLAPLMIFLLIFFPMKKGVFLGLFMSIPTGYIAGDKLSDYFIQNDKSHQLIIMGFLASFCSYYPYCFFFETHFFDHQNIERTDNLLFLGALCNGFGQAFISKSFFAIIRKDTSQNYSMNFKRQRAAHILGTCMSPQVFFIKQDKIQNKFNLKLSPSFELDFIALMIILVVLGQLAETINFEVKNSNLTRPIEEEFKDVLKWRNLSQFLFKKKIFILILLIIFTSLVITHLSLSQTLLGTTKLQSMERYNIMLLFFNSPHFSLFMLGRIRISKNYRKIILVGLFIISLAHSISFIDIRFMDDFYCAVLVATGCSFIKEFVCYDLLESFSKYFDIKDSLNRQNVQKLYTKYNMIGFALGIVIVFAFANEKHFYETKDAYIHGPILVISILLCLAYYKIKIKGSDLAELGISQNRHGGDSTGNGDSGFEYQDGNADNDIGDECEEGDSGYSNNDLKKMEKVKGNEENEENFRLTEDERFSIYEYLFIGNLNSMSFFQARSLENLFE